MIQGKRVVVVMPAYNAETTLSRTCSELDSAIVDETILVDDCSQDGTARLSRSLGLRTLEHATNLGYGANQKTCYRAALEAGADIVVLLHPDYQYSPKLVPAMAWMIATGEYDCVLGSRMLRGNALRGGMPLYKFLANRALTLYLNLMLGQGLSEHFTGLRAYSAQVLRTVPLDRLNDDFIFDIQILAQLRFHRFRIAEMSCPTLYHDEASTMNWSQSLKCGRLTLRIGLDCLLGRMRLRKSKYKA